MLARSVCAFDTLLFTLLSWARLLFLLNVAKLISISFTRFAPRAAAAAAAAAATTYNTNR